MLHPASPEKAVAGLLGLHFAASDMPDGETEMFTVFGR